MKKRKYSKDLSNESLSRYLKDIGKTRLLTLEEESELARRVREGDKEALELLVKSNLRFVVSVAKQYQNQGLSIDDLINEGNLGLIKAAERFDETKGFKFISYAVWWIRQSIMQAIAEQSRLVRLPLNRIAVINKITKANSAFEQDNSRNANTTELAEELDMNEDEIKLALEIATRTISLDTQINTNDDTNILLDVIPNDHQPSPDSLLVRESLKNEVASALSSLTSKEAIVVKYYFGIERDIPLTLEEIGEHLDLTRERVRQIKEKAIKKLKHSSRSSKLKVFLG
jgi:RNA polymerase primary sigma factor